MSDEENQGKDDDLFEGMDRGSEVPPTGGQGPNSLEKRLSENKTGSEEEEVEFDPTGGYSPEAHKDTLKKVRDRRGKRLQSATQKVEDYWAKTDRAVAEAMNIAPGFFMTQVYKAVNKLSGGKISLYKRDARKAMERLRREAESVDVDIAKLESRLTGKVEYIAPTDAESVQKRNYVKEEEKGLRYKLSEATDEARILGIEYRNGQLGLNEMREGLATIDSDIQELENGNDSAKEAKLGGLTGEKTKALREKNELELTQREYEQELVDYEKKIDRVQSKISLYESIIRKGNRKIRQLQAGIDILADYIQERDDLVSVHDLLRDLKSLDTEHERINKTIGVYDNVVGSQIQDLKETVERNDMEYSTRPLMQQVDTMAQEEQVATQKDMGRILGKLGIA